MPRYCRWNDEDSANLRALFEDGSVDPSRTIGTEYMYQNHSDIFEHIENVRNFHNNFRRVAAE